MLVGLFLIANYTNTIVITVDLGNLVINVK